MKKPKFSVSLIIIANEHVYTVEFADGTRDRYMEMDLESVSEND